MTEKEYLLHAFEKEMLPKIYGFCRLKTNDVSEAEDLSQDICLEVLKSINSGKRIENLNAFVWSISNHMFFNMLRKKKHGDTLYLPENSVAPDDPEAEYILEEQKRLLRRELSLMSGNYRKAVVMHYFDEMSCEEIANKLGKSVGTVKWWLHDARTAMEKGINTMRDYGEKSYRPGKLFMSCTGQFGADREPMSCAKRASAQNILLAAYKQPLTITELCEELGISAPYIEDEVEYLVENQLMKEVSKGKYQTDFVILPGNNLALANKIYEECFPEFFEKLMAFLESKKEVLTEKRFNTAGFDWSRLLWVYLHIFPEIQIGFYTYANKITVRYDDIPLRPNGGKWIALGYDNGMCMPEKMQREKYHAFDGPVHKNSMANVQGFYHWWNNADSSVFFETPVEVFELCREIIKGNVNISDLNDEQKYLFSIALEKKLFVKTEDGYTHNYYYINRAEYREMLSMSEEICRELLPLVHKAYSIICAEYEKAVPAHLHWQMGNFLTNGLNFLVTCSLFEAEKRDLLSVPEESNKTWLSLFATE
ncbi:MAG: RNA polymerase sigma factor [Clostridia bacterium]|nr:RNA polymerase sigma factor [Clostridia bacterium]